MTVRRKTLGIIGLGLIILVGALWFISQAIVSQSFARLEENEVHEHIDLSLMVLGENLASLESTNSDYSVWDDTYNFVQTGSNDYVQSNLIDSTFTNLRLSIMVFFDDSGRIIYSQGFDFEQHQRIPLPDALLTQLANDQNLQKFSSDTDHHNGILMTSSMPLLISSQPILTSSHHGPIKGTLLIGRYLSEDEIHRWSVLAGSTVSIHVYDPAEMPADFTREDGELRPEATMIRPLNDKIIVGHRLLTDFTGVPVLVLHVEVGREIYAIGRDTLIAFLAMLLILGVLVGIGVIFLLERGFLKRLDRLSRRVLIIGGQRDFASRLLVDGEDEISSLARSINRMLDSLDESQRQQLRLNQELEGQIEQLAAASADKERFFTHAAHEFRTPLATLNTRLYLAYKKPEKFEEHLRVFEQVSAQLVRLVEDIFDVARHGKESVDLDREVACLQTLIESTQHALQGSVERRRVHIETILPETLLYARLDVQRFTRAFSNLLTYAASFSLSDKTITIELKTISESIAQILITAHDMSIKPGQLPQLFEPFARASEGGGTTTGLGLTIAREIVVLHGGSLDFQPNESDGGVFIITLPCVPNSPQRPPPAAAAAESDE